MDPVQLAAVLAALVGFASMISVELEAAEEDELARTERLFEVLADALAAPGTVQLEEGERDA